MCLAVPLRIVSLDGNGMAVGEHSHVCLEFSTILLDSPKVGDFALVHAGVALEILDTESARETLAMLKEVVDGSSQF